MKFIFIVFVLMFANLVAAQTRKFYNAADIYGTAFTEPNSVCKDGNGFIWIASKEGVARLADNNIKMYSLPYSSINVISVEVAADGNRLAAFTNQGEIFTYDPVADRFDRLMNLPERLGRRSIYLSQVEFDGPRGLWLAASTGLYHAAPDGSIVRVEGIDDALGDVTVDTDGYLLAVGPGGIYKVDPESRKAMLICDAGGVFPTIVRPDKREGRIWVGTMSNGLYYVDPAGRRLVRAEAPEFPRQYVRDIEFVTDSTMWCGIDGRGIYELSRDGKKVLNRYRDNSDNPYSIPGNGIQDMLFDAPERIWVCSYTGGVALTETGTPTAVMHSRQSGSARNSLPNNYIYALTEDAYGQVWIGTNSGLSCWSPEGDSWTNLFNEMGNEESFIIPSVCADDDGNIWVGTYSHGAYVIDARTKAVKAHHTHTDGILSNNGFVFSIIKDGRGDIWLAGMIGGILRYDREKRAFENYPSIPVQSMADLNDSTLLLISSNRLMSLDKRTKQYSTLLSENIIRDLAITDERIWVATSGNGLLCYDLATGKSRAMGTAQGFPSDRISSLLHDNGKLLFATDKGLFIFDIQEETVRERRFPTSIDGNNFTPNAALRLASGSTAWGTSKGLLVVADEPYAPESTEGHIFINDILISGLSLREYADRMPSLPLDSLQSITFDYAHNDIAFDILSLGAMSYSPLLSYKMDGVDEAWNGPGDFQTIRYSSLDPGKYRLHIRMHNPNIVDERTIEVVITPPFWNTWWFRTMALLLVAAVIATLLRAYINRLNRKNAESKLQFFVTTAHDLRTSLTLIKASIEQLRDSTSLSATDHEYVRLASVNVDHLTSLTTKLMDFQKIDTGKVKAQLIWQDAVEFIRHRIAMFSAFAEKKSIAIEFSSDAETYMTGFDTDKMEQIVDNIISNAIKYSYPDSTIKITLSCKPDAWTLSVADHGIGISKKDKKMLFREFYRGKNAVNSNIAGSGIGLAMVKRLVELHEGTITLESRENVGSTFEISIPFRPESVCLQETEPLSPAPDAPDADEETPDSEEMRILIAEDNDDLREFMRRALCGQFKVTVAEDGAKAWEIARETVPDLIVSDIMMPNMDGFELCRLVKSTFETSHIPVILLSALTEQTDEMHGIGMGADEYLTKPFNTKTLSMRIASIIRSRRVLGERIVNKIAQESEEAAVARHDSNPLNDAFVTQAIEVITTHLDNSDFGKEDFAKAMGVSTSLLFKKVKSLTGLSVVDFIKKVRMEHAMKLLEDPTLSISDIAFKCGFSTIGYFSTVFKKYFGKTPSECRKI